MSQEVSQLQSQLVSMLDRSELAELAAKTGIHEPKETRRATNLALPTILENLGNFSRSANGPTVIQRLLEASRDDMSDGGEELAQHLFGNRLPRAAEQLAHRAGINGRSSLATLKATSQWALTAIASLADMPDDAHAVARMLNGHGAQRGDSAPAREASPQPAARRAAAPAERAAVQTQDRPVATDATIESNRSEQASSDAGGLSGKLIGAALAALLICGGAAFALFGGGGSDAGDDAVVATAPAVDAPAEAAATDADGAGDAQDDTVSAPAETEPAADASADASTDDSSTSTDDSSAPAETAAVPIAASTDTTSSDPTLAKLVVPMRDIKGVSPNAGGSVAFVFNKLTGEICFEVGSFGVDAPYAAHIHAGDYGVKGGVVADLGLLSDGASGCIDNLPADTKAILAQPSRHYAELHDAGGEWTVRGQLSETVENQGIVPFTIPLRDILGTSTNSSGVLSFDFNTLTGEVCYSVVAVGVTPPFAGHIHAGGFGIKGGVVLDLGELDTGNNGCVQNKVTDIEAILADPGGHYAELHDAGGEWTVRGQLTETVDNPGVVTLAVPMIDIKNIEPSASGTLTFDFNTVTGEICFDVSATNITAPFDAHIHAGDYGVKGGVVAALGALEDGSGGCIRNDPADTLAILGDPSGHYAELHDAAGEWTIRGQLSEASAPIDPNATNLLVDTDGGGAILRLVSGTIFLEGDVDSQAVADDMLASLDGITTPLINNLNIVAGAPLPSGRVVIGDNVFFDTGSDEINEIDASTIAALVDLAASRPDWVMAIVGHTDDIGSDVYNLELSLRRAEALRRVLVSQGMDSENMRIRGAGETAPIADNRSEAGRAQNRRIEFEFSPA